MTSPAAKVSIIATFPPSFFLENIVALCDDTILVTVANRQSIYAIPPPAVPGQPRQPYLLHQFDNDAWPMGITAALNNPTLTYILTTDFTSQGSGTHHLWVLDTSNVAAACHPKILVQFPSGAKGLNGLTPLSSNTFLAADSFAGCIWRIDVEMDTNGVPASAQVSEWMRDPLFDGHLVLPDFQPGANGLKYSHALRVICFSNTQQKIFGTIAVDTEKWAPAGRPRILVRGALGDDMVLDDHFEGGSVAYLTTHRQNTILRIPLQPKSDVNPEKQDAVAYDTIAEGTQENPQVLGPTAGAWKVGHEGKTAYFNCDGGLKNPFPGEAPRFGRVLQVDFA